MSHGKQNARLPAAPLPPGDFHWVSRESSSVADNVRTRWENLDVPAGYQWASSIIYGVGVLVWPQPSL